MASSQIPLPTRCLLYQALLWVAEEIPPIEDGLFRSFSEPSWVVVKEEHKRALLIALRSGTIPTEGIAFGWLARPYTKLGWQTVEIRPVYWEEGNVDWKRSALTVERWEQNQKLEGSFRVVTMPTAALLKAFPSEKKSTEFTAELPSPAPGIQKGRPPKYDWLAFHAEIAIRADLDGLPDTQAELERAMAEWCLRTWGREPPESMVRDNVSRIYRERRKARK